MRLAHRLFVLTGPCLFILFSVSTPAQEALDLPRPDATTVDVDDDAPAYLAVVDGMASIERDGSTEVAEENEPLLAGDRLRTQRGRVEILFADGSAIDVDENSDLDLLSDSLIRLLAGRIRVSMARTAVTAAEVLEYRVDAAPGSAILRTAGDYRVTLAGAQLQLAALRGSAELQNSLGRTLVRAGMTASVVSNREPSLPFGFNSASWDAFDRWVEDQRNARLSSVSSRYLPADLRYYGGTLDQYGSWSNEPGYGNVWYPRVDVGWRPYYAGRWSFAARLGWLWVGTDRWSWPTHHYGRWGLGASDRWFWIPDRRWSPAWVTWGYTPDYVAWCPIGFNGAPVVSLAALQYSRGWSTLPLRAFRPNVIVPRHVVDARLFSPSIRAAVTVRNAGPLLRDPVRLNAPLRGPRSVRLTQPARGSVERGTRQVPATRVQPGTRLERPSAPPQPSLAAPPSQRFPRRESPQIAPQERAISPRAVPRAAPRAEAPRFDPPRPARPESPRAESPRASTGAPSAPSPSGRVERRPEPRVAPQPPRSEAPRATPGGRERPSGAPGNGGAVPRRRGGNDK